MAEKRIPRPRDPIALAKLVVDIATGEVVDKIDDGKDAAVTESGRREAIARSVKLTSAERQTVVQKAAVARWKKY